MATDDQLPATTRLRDGGGELALPPVRDPQQTGYTPIPIPGLTPDERVEVTKRHIACDGGMGPAGHPRVWMRIEDHEVTCPYCSRTFVLAPGAGDDEHGH